MSPARVHLRRPELSRVQGEDVDADRDAGQAADRARAAANS